MFKSGMKLLLAAALAATPMVVLPQAAQAQQPDTQRAYQAGYNNGVNDRNQGKSLNLKTDNWHGINLQAYRQGYENGYRSGGRGAYGGTYGYPQAGYGYGQYGNYGRHRDDDDDYYGQYGNNGYGYGQYGNNEGWHRHHRDDDDRDRDRDRNNQGYYGNGGYYPQAGYGYGNGVYGNNNAMQRAYQAGYNNGVNDRLRNKPLNLKTGNWRGVNLNSYRRGYEDGYRSGGRRRY